MSYQLLSASAPDPTDPGAMCRPTHLDVPLVQTSHTDPSIPSQVDARLLRQKIHLLGLKTGEREHADLGFDVTPLSGCFELD